jgi:hypothetical protein
MFIAFAATAYGYFDVLYGATGGKLHTGEWRGPNALIAYLNSRDNSLASGGTSSEALQYYGNLFFDNTVFDNNGKLLSGNLKPAFSSYSEDVLKDFIDACAEYGKHFLTADTTGIPRLLSYGDATEASVYVPNLRPGQTEQAYKILLPANLAEDIYWAPVTYAISMELPGCNISDWSIELLYSPPGGMGNTFAYQYLVRDATSHNVNRAQGQTEKASNALSLIRTDIDNSLIVFRQQKNAYTASTFVHTLQKPSSGLWSRFLSGPNMQLGKPTGSTIGPQQQLDTLSPASRTGMILMGKSNGTKTEILVGFYNRGTAANPITAIPLILNISRGTSPGFSPDISIVPAIKIRAYAGDVWSSH